jgi:hypothetical protein
VRLAVSVVLAAGALALPPRARVAAAEEAPAPAASPSQAEAAVRALRAARKSKDAATRVAALFEHGKVVHASVADELLRALRKADDPIERKEVFVALALQRPSAKRVVPALARWVAETAEAQQERERRGDPGFPVDPRTGDPAVSTTEGRAALALLEARAAGVREAVRCLRALRDEPPPGVGSWTAFLRDAHDPLVVEVLDAFAAWKVSEAMPAILDLFRCYPTAATWETGAVVDLAGTNASAKRTWTVVFGHPGKQRARPDVHAALSRAIVAITGSPAESPEALAHAMAEAKDVRRR